LHLHYQEYENNLPNMTKDVLTGDFIWHLHGLHTQLLCVMEALVEAGYRPVTFTNFIKQRWPEVEVLPSYYPPDDPRVARHWELDTGGRWG